jgi:hypothetical protein
MNDCRLKVGGVMIEGKTMTLADAVEHVKSQGFSTREALDYIKALPQED